MKIKYKLKCRKCGRIAARDIEIPEEYSTHVDWKFPVCECQDRDWEILEAKYLPKCGIYLNLIDLIYEPVKPVRCPICGKTPQTRKEEVGNNYAGGIDTIFFCKGHLEADGSCSEEKACLNWNKAALMLLADVKKYWRKKSD